MTQDTDQIATRNRCCVGGQAAPGATRSAPRKLVMDNCGGKWTWQLSDDRKKIWARYAASLLRTLLAFLKEKKTKGFPTCLFETGAIGQADSRAGRGDARVRHATAPHRPLRLSARTGRKRARVSLTKKGERFQSWVLERRYEAALEGKRLSRVESSRGGANSSVCWRKPRDFLRAPHPVRSNCRYRSRIYRRET